MPNPMYMDSQKELTWTLQGILVHWLIQVYAYLSLMPEMLFLTVNVIDHILSAHIVSLAKLPLVGDTLHRFQGRGGCVTPYCTLP